MKSCGAEVDWKPNHQKVLSKVGLLLQYCSSQEYFRFKFSECIYVNGESTKIYKKITNNKKKLNNADRVLHYIPKM